MSLLLLISGKWWQVPLKLNKEDNSLSNEALEVAQGTPNFKKKRHCCHLFCKF